MGNLDYEVALRTGAGQASAWAVCWSSLRRERPSLWSAVPTRNQSKYRRRSSLVSIRFGAPRDRGFDSARREIHAIRVLAHGDESTGVRRSGSQGGGLRVRLDLGSGASRAPSRDAAGISMFGTWTGAAAGNPSLRSLGLARIHGSGDDEAASVDAASIGRPSRRSDPRGWPGTRRGGVRLYEGPVTPVSPARSRRRRAGHRARRRRDPGQRAGLPPYADQG